MRPTSPPSRSGERRTGAEPEEPEARAKGAERDQSTLGAALRGWLSTGAALAAAIVAAQGYDSVTVDLQHGMIDDGAALHMLQAVRASGATPLVRVPWLAPAPAMKALDMSAHGVICPMVETPAQAAELVSDVRYPPAGTRSFGSMRAVIAEGAG